MNSRETIRALVKDKRCPSRMGLYESFWPEVTGIWERQGLPQGVSLPEYFNLDIRAIGDDWISTEPFPGTRHIVEENDTTYVEENGWGARMRFWKGKSGTPEHLSFALTSEELWRRRYREPFLSFDIRRFGDLQKRRSEYQRLARGDRFRVYEVLQIFEISRKAMGDIVMLEAMCMNPAWIKDFYQVLTDNIIMHLDYELREVGRPDGIWFYEDLGYVKQPFISPAMYRELVFPYHRRFVEFCHNYDLPVIMHTCGNIRPLFDDILSTGIDCLQPLEAKAGQNVVTMAESASRRIAYMGNLDIRAFETNDPKQLEAEILPKLKAIREKRIPYIFQSDHSVPGSVRLETYQHALELYHQNSQY